MPTIVKKHLFSVTSQALGAVGGTRFSKVSQVSAEVEEITYHQAGSFTPQKFAGRVTFPNVTLEAGITSDFALYEWFSKVANISVIANDGRVGAGLAEDTYKYDLDVVQHDNDQRPVWKWRIVRCWPRMFSAGEWDASVSEAVIHSVELVNEGFIRIPIQY